MSKKCARCDKTVYPLEELKCLDKIWHKACFKCQECGMALNMRTYKGFNRMPYCNAHCPQAKHTTVADTPEIRRIQENTKIQSTVKYHEEFEKQKGKVTQIADDPETLRIKQNTRIISNVAYHGDLEKKAIMEQKRPAAERNGDSEHTGREDLSPTQPPAHPPSIPLEPEPIIDQVVNPATRRIGSIADYDPLNDNYGSLATGSKGDGMNFNKVGVPDGQIHQMSQPIQQNTGATYRAMYDYAAADVDEVSFVDGDIILNCTPIDEGWMTGTVQRTGLTGMLPANYVEPFN